MTGDFVRLGNAVEEGAGGVEGSVWFGEPRVLGPSWARMPILTIGFFGVSILWSVEMTYASPYLLSLGISKSHMSLVFLAGPLSGLLVQPLVGALADSSKSRFGRRRPYMVLGCLATAIAMLLLGFTREAASLFTERATSANDTLTKWLAVFSIYSMDFAINAVMAVDRALIVDTLSTSEQAEGNAWAARMAGVGGLVGFFVGNVNLPYWLPWLGQSQLAILSVVASFLIMGSHFVTVAGVTERILLSTSSHQEGLGQELKHLFQNFKVLPASVKHIFKIQFFASLAWFPMMFFLSTYITELYQHANPASSEGEGMRLASRMQFYTSILSLTSTLILPFFAFTEESLISATKTSNFFEAKVTALVGCLFKAHLASIWAIGHGIFAICLLSTWFITNVQVAVWVFIATGISGAIGSWAPYVLIGEAIHPDSSDALPDESYIPLIGAQVSGANGRASFLEDEEDEGGDTENQLHEKSDVSDNISTKAGAIFGLHNVFIVIPQLIITGLSSVIFAIFDPDKSVLHNHQASDTSQMARNGTSLTLSNKRLWLIRETERIGDNKNVNSVAIVFCFGGIAALMASALTYRLSRELQRAR